MSKIVIHSLTFAPDNVSTAFLFSDIATGLKQIGHDITVITTTPHYNYDFKHNKTINFNRHLFGIYYTSYYNGILVYHIPTKKYKNTIIRILGFIKWHIISFILLLFQKNINVIISPSPPLTLGIINIIISKLKSCNTIYNVQEIYPDLLIELKGLKSSFLINILKSMEKFVYSRSTKTTTIDEVFYNTIIDRFSDKRKLSIIPNFVDTSIYKPISNPIIDKLFLDDKDSIKVLYAGNIGFAQDWEILINLAKKTKNKPIIYYVIGDGIQINYLKKQISSFSLNNIKILPYQSRDKIPHIISYSDLQFIFMTQSTENHGLPSKIYSIMACGKPLIISSGKNTPLYNFFKDKKCAFVSYNLDYNKRADELYNFIISTDKFKLFEMGMEGVKIVANNYTKDIVISKYNKLLSEI